MSSQLKNLNCPVEEESQQYICECASCERAARYRAWLPRWLAGGFLLPLLWILNLTLYLYTQWALDHEPTHAQIPPEDLPTVHQVHARINATHLKISQKTVEEIDRVNETTTALEELEGTRDQFQDHTEQFLTQVARAILDSHEAMRGYYRKWALWTLLAILAYSTTLALLLAAYRTNHSQ